MGAHIQADAYRDTFPDGEEDAKYLRKQEAHWRLTAHAWLSEEAAWRCAEAAKKRAVAEEGGADAIFAGTNTPASILRDLEACDRAINRMGWAEIKAFQSQPGQSPFEDAGGYFLRCIKALFGIRPNARKTYREAARRLVAEARANIPTETNQ